MNTYYKLTPTQEVNEHHANCCCEQMFCTSKWVYSRHYYISGPGLYACLTMTVEYNRCPIVKNEFAAIYLSQLLPINAWKYLQHIQNKYPHGSRYVACVVRWYWSALPVTSILMSLISRKSYDCLNDNEVTLNVMDKSYFLHDRSWISPWIKSIFD